MTKEIQELCWLNKQLWTGEFIEDQRLEMHRALEDKLFALRSLWLDYQETMERSAASWGDSLRKASAQIEKQSWQPLSSCPQEIKDSGQWVLVYYDGFERYAPSRQLWSPWFAVRWIDGKWYVEPKWDDSPLEPCEVALPPETMYRLLDLPKEVGDE